MKQKKNLSGGEGVAVVIGVILMFVAVVVLGALFTMLAWNVGLTALVAACGGHIGNIGFWAAVGINIVWGIITSPFRRTKE
jgi:hypothetical protein